MTAPVLTAREDWPVDLAVEDLTSHGFTALPVVVGGGRLVGIVSERHLLPDPLSDRRARTVGGLIERDVVTVQRHEFVADALRLMDEHDLRAVPVVDGFHRLAGIVTRRDILRPLGRS
ncbi:CBS domain-containing protein [Pseudonocardia zijingensis]